MKGLLNQKTALNFILGGNAVFTIVDNNTGQRFTYKFRAPRNKPECNILNSIIFCSVLTGNDNENHYKYFAFIRPVNNSFIYKFGKQKAKISQQSPSVQLIQNVLANLRAGKEMNNIEIYHEGHCGVCGKTLTVPESIISGIGPICAGRMHKQHLHYEFA